ncbi:MAG: hypothetical protein D3906_15775 [Candidatus Electrothrix sp. AUS1_2]|nr:hypothetical protein [Candidatus Electrothrix sp. AUS1_2]
MKGFSPFQIIPDVLLLADYVESLQDWCGMACYESGGNDGLYERAEMGNRVGTLMKPRPA